MRYGWIDVIAFFLRSYVGLMLVSAVEYGMLIQANVSRPLSTMIIPSGMPSSGVPDQPLANHSTT
jgi:hypothetical protein